MKRLLFFLTALLLIGSLWLFFQESHYEARFPIKYIPYSGQPTTEVTIEGNHYPITIDLGSSTFLSLKNEILEKIQKEYTRSDFSIDLHGNQYNAKYYLIPEVKIRNMKFTNLEVREETFKPLTIYDDTGRTPDEISRQTLGRIGLSLFENQNLLLDFHNSVMFACCHLKHRAKDGYRLDKLVQIPLEMNRYDGIIVQANTDLGTLRFALDTGASLSLIKPSLIKGQPLEEWKPGISRYRSSKFILGEKNFGSFDLTLFEMVPAFDNIDGIIGMDFLKEHVVYLDFKKKLAYIGKASEVSGEIRVPSYVKD